MANQLRCTSKSVDRYAATMQALSAPAPTHASPAVFQVSMMCIWFVTIVEKSTPVQK
jgi:hypothetical protein